MQTTSNAIIDFSLTEDELSMVASDFARERKDILLAICLLKDNALKGNADAISLIDFFLAAREAFSCAIDFSNKARQNNVVTYNVLHNMLNNRFLYEAFESTHNEAARLADECEKYKKQMCTAYRFALRHLVSQAPEPPKHITHYPFPFPS